MKNKINMQKENILQTNLTLSSSMQSHIKLRNTFWKNNPSIPRWININEVELDQFFTKKHIAEMCYKNLLYIISEDEKKLNKYHFVEPSIGSGNFYKLLPAHKRIGIDIAPKFFDENVITHDFLSWFPENKKTKIITIGNPPFGYRAWLALEFMKHASLFSEYIGMILPMSFQSDGKGSPKHRMKQMQLVHSEILPKDSFEKPDGKQVKINALWQVWKKGENIINEEKKCDQWVDIFTVDQRKERLCGHEKMHLADFFLQRTFYHTPPDLVTNFNEVKYTCGYGIIIKKDKKEITNILNNTNWNNYCNLTAHSCHHISMYHIKRALTDKGFINE